MCFGWKGGIGTSSRKAPAGYGGYTLGVLVQTNFGGVMSMGGAPVGKRLGKYAFSSGQGSGSGDGSCMVIVATGAPLLPRDLKRVAARAVFGLARTGSSYSNGSGDYAIAFSTADSARVRAAKIPATLTVLVPDQLSPLFEMALEATEEAVYNSLLQATTIHSKFGTAEALPIEAVQSILAEYGIHKPESK